MGALTTLQVLVALTPLYYLITQGLIGVPGSIAAPVRLGLMILLPWPWAIGHRRFHQGLLIRLGRSPSVRIGTVARLAGTFAARAVGHPLRLPGVVVAALSTAAGVLCEAAFVGLRVQPQVKRDLPPAAPGEAVNLSPLLAVLHPPLPYLR